MSRRIVLVALLAVALILVGCSDGGGRIATSASLPTTARLDALDAPSSSAIADAKETTLAPLGPRTCAPASDEIVALRRSLLREAACFGPRGDGGPVDPASTVYRKVLAGDAGSEGVVLDDAEDAWARGVRDRCARLVTMVEVQSVTPEGCRRSLPDEPSRDSLDLAIHLRAVAIEAWSRAATGDFREAARLGGRAIRVVAILGRSDADIDWLVSDSTIVDLAKLVDRWWPRLDDAARRDVAEDVAVARSALLGESERFGAYALGLRAKALAPSTPVEERMLMLDALDLLLDEIRRGDTFGRILARCSEEAKDDLPLMEALDRAKAKPADLDSGQRRAFLRHLRGQLVRMFEPVPKRGVEAAQALDALAARR